MSLAVKTPCFGLAFTAAGGRTEQLFFGGSASRERISRGMCTIDSDWSNWSRGSVRRVATEWMDPHAKCHASGSSWSCAVYRHLRYRETDTVVFSDVMKNSIFQNPTYVCRLFVRNATCSLHKIFSVYSDNIQVVSTRNLESVVSDKWFAYHICSLCLFS